MNAAARDDGAIIRRYELQLALDRWRGGASDGSGGATRYAAAQGIVYSLLRHSDPVAADAFHEMNVRKALSVTPVVIQTAHGGLGRATLGIGVWERELGDLLDEALRQGGDLRLELVGHAALLLHWTLCEAWGPDEGAEIIPENVRMRFTSPTSFGYGRYQNGTARAHIVPDAGPVVSSWLRAWMLTGDTSLDWMPKSPEDLATCVSLMEMRDVRTATIVERSSQLTGFLGECVYRWEGRDPRGWGALAKLARFAGVCGTGAKTGRGFGQTVWLNPSTTVVQQRER